MPRLILSCFLALSINSGLYSQELIQTVDPNASSQSKLVFLGDSNTYAGRFVAVVDANMRKFMRGEVIEVLNLGVSSETASGLSEPDHPFHRPCVHSRVDKVLRMLKPATVVMCYGMNDGIYEPLSPEILDSYKTGMLELAAKVNATGANLIVMTPPPFEAEAIRSRGGNFGPNANGNYAWNAPVESYDKTVEAMAQWCLTNPFNAFAVVDLRTPLLELRQREVEHDPDFLLTGDGVHFKDAAHDAVADALLRALPLGEDFVVQELSEEELNISSASNQILRDAYLSATGKNRPGLKAGLPIVHAERQAAALRTTNVAPELPQ